MSFFFIIYKFDNYISEHKIESKIFLLKTLRIIN